MLNTHTLDNARRTIFAELVRRGPATSSGGLSGQNALVPVLLPWSTLDVDGTEYLETNGMVATADLLRDGGGAHAVPSHGIVVASEYRERSPGVRDGGVQPADLAIHSFGWI